MDRNLAIKLIAGFPSTASQLLHGVPELDLRRRPAPDVWSALEYAGHTGDTIAWYHHRIRQALSQQVPQFAPFDWDTACREARYRERSTAQVIADIDRCCTALVTDLSELGPADWKRGGIGSDGSPRSVDQLVSRAAHEAMHHALDIETVLPNGLAPRRFGNVGRAFPASSSHRQPPVSPEG